MGSTILQFLLSTAYIVVELRMLVESVALGPTSQALITAYWVDSSKHLQVASRVIYITNVSLALYFVFNDISDVREDDHWRLYLGLAPVCGVGSQRLHLPIAGMSLVGPRCINVD